MPPSGAMPNGMPKSFEMPLSSGNGHLPDDLYTGINAVPGYDQISGPNSPRNGVNGGNGKKYNNIHQSHEQALASSIRKEQRRAARAMKLTNSLQQQTSRLQEWGQQQAHVMTLDGNLGNLNGVNVNGDDHGSYNQLGVGPDNWSHGMRANNDLHLANQIFRDMEDHGMTNMGVAGGPGDAPTHQHFTPRENTPGTQPSVQNPNSFTKRILDADINLSMHNETIMNAENTDTTISPHYAPLLQGLVGEERDVMNNLLKAHQQIRPSWDKSSGSLEGGSEGQGDGGTNAVTGGGNTTNLVNSSKAIADSITGGAHFSLLSHLGNVDRGVRSILNQNRLLKHEVTALKQREEELELKLIILKTEVTNSKVAARDHRMTQKTEGRSSHGTTSESSNSSKTREARDTSNNKKSNSKTGRRRTQF